MLRRLLLVSSLQKKVTRCPKLVVYHEWRGEKDVRGRGGTFRAEVIAAVIQRRPVFHRRQTGRSSLMWQLVAGGAGKLSLVYFPEFC